MTKNRPRTPLGDFIRERMDELGIKAQNDLAELSGLSITTLSVMMYKKTFLKDDTVEKLSHALQCEPWEIRARSLPKRTRRYEGLRCDPSATLCWRCQNAVPDRKGHGCSWSRSFVPVKGWTVTVRDKRQDRSYTVLECPEFVPDEDPEPGGVTEAPKLAADGRPEWDGKIYFVDDYDRNTFFGSWF